MPAKPRDVIQILRAPDGWRWVMRSKAGHDLAGSVRAYANPAAVLRAVRRVQAGAKGAEVRGVERPGEGG